MAHAMPVILLFTDLQFNLIVIWNASFIPIYFFLLGIYLLMNLIYSVEVSPVYEIIDYKTWLSYVFLLACGVFMVACHYIFRLFCKYCK